MKTFVCIVAVCTLAAPLAAWADPRSVIGAAGTYSAFAYTDVERASGYQAHATHRFPLATNALQVELGYLDTGTARIDGTGGMGLNFNGANLSLGLVLPGGFGAHDIIWFKGGVYHGTSELRAVDYSQGRTSTGPLFGVGLEWMWTSFIGMRVEYQALLKVRDSVNNGNIGVLNLGLVFALPEGRAASLAAADPPACTTAAPASSQASATAR